MDQTSKDRLKANFSSAHKMLSNWVFGAIGALGAIWFALPPEQQQVLLQNSPLPAWSYPVVMTAVGVLARLWPQKSLMPPELGAQDTQPLEGEPE
jgi:hypothetical protein